jgi:hypothetical protein
MWVLAMTDQRTTQQRKSLELWCKQSARVLRDAGIDLQALMAVKEVSVPISHELFKDVIFRPIFTALTGEKSTADANTKDYDVVYHTLVRHFGDKLGVVLPAWPSRFNEGEENE